MRSSKWTALLLAFAMLLGLSPAVFAFDDVPADAYYAEAVAWALEQGVTTGASAAAFRPDDPCTRAQTAAFLYRSVGEPAPKGENPFRDVDGGAYYAGAVVWAAGSGVTEGTGDGQFSPDAECTRAQCVTFLWRLYGSPEAEAEAPFTDVPADAFYAGAVAWAYEKGVTRGTTPETFRPDSPCTRAQIVTLLYRADQLKTPGFVLMNIPYGEFYRAELAPDAPAVDAVTSATKNKPRTGTLAGGSYHTDPEGSDISGVIYPVYVPDLAMLEDGLQITDESAVEITVTNRGQTTTTRYEGAEALFEAPDHAWYRLDEAPACYKIMNFDGSFGPVQGEASSVEGVEAEVKLGARHANIEFALSGTEGVAKGDRVSGVILTDSEGQTYALRHIANIWRATELGWNYGDLDLAGKTIASIRYITPEAVIDYPVSIPIADQGNH